MPHIQAQKCRNAFVLVNRWTGLNKVFAFERESLTLATAGSTILIYGLNISNKKMLKIDKTKHKVYKSNFTKNRYCSSVNFIC